MLRSSGTEDNMKITLLIALLMPASCFRAAADMLLYSNTTTDTGDTVLYSVGPYTALGDDIHLASAGTADMAEIELFNNGDAGTFDAQLNFFNVGAPVGSPLGSFGVADIPSAGSDVIDIHFVLGAGLSVPQNLIFTVTVSNMSPNMDLGVDMFQPPTVGSSDPSFMIVESSDVYNQLGTNDENVYFQLNGTAEGAAPEGSSLTQFGTGLLLMGIGAWGRRHQSRSTRSSGTKVKLLRT
jgi:hypothetical protein